MSIPPWQPPTRPRTLRIRCIPPHVTQDELRVYLKELLGYDGFILSLFPSKRDAIATITLTEGEPPTFSECSPGTRIYLSYPETVAGLVVDCDFLGITPLYSAQMPVVGIIAVTGLADHAYESWKPRHQPKMWLRDFLPSEIGEHIRILTFGYDTSRRDDRDAPTIHTFATSLLKSVAGARTGDNERNRPLIFIGHSLGGLVIKQAIAHASGPEGRDTDKVILSSCVGIFFFGVPSRGLDLRRLRTLVREPKHADYIYNLSEDSDFLRFTCDDFLRAVEVHLGGCQIVSFFETRDTRAVGVHPDGSWTRSGAMIRAVPEASATFGPRPHGVMHKYVAIAADHSTMVKFAHNSDPHYTIVR
ncbi:hypothetical protein BZA05DRAFT_349757, partial [Tricharina praecox]|uniref:uncharacterized protein n=1 Tax=Tricharina praecox TaxID=43433 RepID=UPI00221F6E84